MAAGIGLGFLVGSVAILLIVVYFTRIRNPAVPRAGTIDPDRTRAGTAGTETRSCDLCERERSCREVGDLIVCADCMDDLMI